MVKKKVCIKQYICTNLFLCFLVRERQLALDADSVVCRKEEGGAPAPLFMSHCSVAEVV